MIINDNDSLWNAIIAREGKVFTTNRGKEFTFHIKTNKAGDTQSAMVIDPKNISITRATVLLAFHNALEIVAKKGFVKKPGKLGTYGAIYLYPVFEDIGICSDQAGMQGMQTQDGILTGEQDDVLTGAQDHVLTDEPDDVLAGEQDGILAGKNEEEPITIGESFERTCACCPNCGYTLSEDFDYCPKCGTKIVR